MWFHYYSRRKPSPFLPLYLDWCCKEHRGPKINGNPSFSCPHTGQNLNVILMRLSPVVLVQIPCWKVFYNGRRINRRLVAPVQHLSCSDSFRGTDQSLPEDDGKCRTTTHIRKLLETVTDRKSLPAQVQLCGSQEFQATILVSRNCWASSQVPPWISTEFWSRPPSKQELQFK